MIEYINGNIFESPAQVIVNTVNTVGVMGKGIALAFKQRYPDMFVAYREMCEKNLLTVGKLMLWNAPDHMVLLFPTKENWRNPSKTDYIERGLQRFVNTYAEKNITSIAFPKLGCGNGELNWDDVRPVMERYLKPLPIDIYIYLGAYITGIPEHKEPAKTLSWLKKNAKDLSFNALKEDISIESSLIPIAFSCGGDDYSASYNDGIEFVREKDKRRFTIPESTFYELWDSVRSQGIVKSSQDILEVLTLSLLCSLNYLSPITLMDATTLKMVPGFQVNEGVGRVFDILGKST